MAHFFLMKSRIPTWWQNGLVIAFYYLIVTRQVLGRVEIKKEQLKPV